MGTGKKKNIGKKLKGGIKQCLTLISPKVETVFNYRFSCGEWLDWKNPQDINAWINVLKVTDYYNNPEITRCADKYRIRDWLREQGEERLCPKLYGVYNTPEEIDWDKLPGQVAVKCNHTCGANLIIKDKSQIDITEANRLLHKWLKDDYWKEGEVQYRFIEKKIIAEEYLGDGDNLKTYKFFCFQGEPKVLYLSIEEDRYIDYYDMEFKKLSYRLPEHPHYPYEVQKPENFDEMVRIARKLCRHFPFVRVDLYNSFGRIYISELTFVPTGGYMKIEPKEVLREWGSWMSQSSKQDIT